MSCLDCPGLAVTDYINEDIPSRGYCRFLRDHIPDLINYNLVHESCPLLEERRQMDKDFFERFGTRPQPTKVTYKTEKEIAHEYMKKITQESKRLKSTGGMS